MQQFIDERAECICAKNLFSVHCPYSFYQGGKVLHVVNTYTQGGSQRYIELTRDNSNNDIAPLSMLSSRMKDDTLDGSSKSGGSDVSDDFTKVDIEIPKPFPRDMRTKSESSDGQVSLISANSLMKENRVDLRKFEALAINGQSLTTMSIGGFTVDTQKAAEKAAIIAPLPPAKLPKIYIDSTMNFLHHFFQGLERLIGRMTLLEIVAKSKFATDEKLVLLPLIENIMTRGYEKKDNNLTVFVKSVFATTFERDERSDPNDEHRGLVVAANLWGFRYIECGIEMKEADLQMWLKTNYDNFKNLHFDTFKDSGVPAFVMDGVQTRYDIIKPSIESEVKCQPRMFRRREEMIHIEDDPLPELIPSSYHEREPRRYRSHRTKPSVPQRQNTGSSLFSKFK